MVMSDDQKEVAGFEVYARPIDIARVFAKEFVLVWWVMDRANATTTSRHQMEMSLSRVAASVLESVLAELSALFPDEMVAVYHEAHDEFATRLSSSFPDGKLLNEEDIDRAIEEAVIVNQAEARSRSEQALVEMILKRGAGDVPPVA
jgi:hypothetical protein